MIGVIEMLEEILTQLCSLKKEARDKISVMFFFTDFYIERKFVHWKLDRDARL